MTEIAITILGVLLCFYAGALSVHNRKCRRCYRRGFDEGVEQAINSMVRQIKEQRGEDSITIERVER